MQVQSCSQLPIETESKHLEINTEFQLSAGGHSTSASKWQAWNKRGQGSNNWINTFVYLYMVSNDIDSVDWRFGLNQMPETPCQARPLCPLCWDSDHCGNVGRFSLGGRGHRKTTGSSVKQPVGLNLVVLDNQDTPPALLLLLLAILFKEIELVFLRETVVLLLTEAPVPFPPSGEGEVGHLKAPPTPLFHLLLYLLLHHLLGAPLGLWASPVAIAWGWGEGGREGEPGSPFQLIRLPSPMGKSEAREHVWTRPWPTSRGRRPDAPNHRHRPQLFSVFHSPTTPRPTWEITGKTIPNPSLYPQLTFHLKNAIEMKRGEMKKSIPFPPIRSFTEW